MRHRRGGPPPKGRPTKDKYFYPFFEGEAIAPAASVSVFARLAVLLRKEVLLRKGGALLGKGTPGGSGPVAFLCL